MRKRIFLILESQLSNYQFFLPDVTILLYLLAPGMRGARFLRVLLNAVVRMIHI
jgi:hypothetical protein